jgi:hypothetical protein
MYVVLVTSKTREVLSDCIPELNKAFPKEVFTVEGSEEKGYKLRIEGIGDEKGPRAFAAKFMKTWMPKPKEDGVVIIKEKT